MLTRIPGFFQHRTPAARFTPSPGSPGPQPGRIGGSAGLLRWLKTLFVLLAGNQTLTGGFSGTSYDNGTVSSGTLTPAAANGNFQQATANGAHTLAPPSTTCSIVLDYTNGASAGALTTSGFTKVTGDTYAITNANKYRFFITKGNAGSHLAIQAMQ